MSIENYVMTGPDEAGWYWFRPDSESETFMVYVTYDGRPLTLDPQGDMIELDNTIGLWEIAEPHELEY